jgi:hypothetical protein
MRKVAAIIASLFLLASQFTACTDFTTIGADLLDEDRLGLDFVDTITIKASSIPQDSIITYSGASSASQLSRHLFGDYSDPVFGRVQASVYTQIMLGLDRTGFFPVIRRPNFQDAVLDSVVLVLTLDTSLSYALPTAPFGIDVFRVTQPIDATKDYYSNVSFSTQSSPIGSAMFSPRPDTLRVLDYRNFFVDTLAFPHIRIPISLALGNELLQLDTTQYQSDSLFSQILNGIYLKPSGQTDGLVALNLLATLSSLSANLASGLYVYYSDGNGQPQQYQFEMNNFAARVSSFNHNYLGSPAASRLNSTAIGDTLLLLQGMAGIDVKIELPHIQELRGAIVNYATIEIPIGAFVTDDTFIYKSAPEVYLVFVNNDGRLESISDVSLSGNQRRLIFGGQIVKGTEGNPDMYKMNISSHIADMIYGRVSNEMYLQILFKGQSPARSVLNGPKHPTNPMKIKIAYTKT